MKCPLCALALSVPLLALSSCDAARPRERAAPASSPAVQLEAERPSTPPAASDEPVVPEEAPACTEPVLSESGWTRALASASRTAPDDALLHELETRCVEEGERLASRLNELGLAWHRRRRYDVSAQLFRVAAQRNGASSAPRFNLACALSKLGAVDDALEALDALRARPDAERWQANAVRDDDLRALWERPGAWRVVSDDTPRLLRGALDAELPPHRIETPTETLPLTLPATDDTRAWTEVTLDAAVSRALVAAMNQRYRLRARIAAPEGYGPIVPTWGSEKVPAHVLQIVRRPAVWRPEPGSVWLVLPIRATAQAAHDRAGVALFKQVEGGLALYFVSVDTTLENHGVFEESDVVVARDRSGVGTGVSYDGALIRTFFYVRDGELYVL